SGCSPGERVPIGRMEPCGTLQVIPAGRRGPRRLTRRHVEPTVRTRTTGRGRSSREGATTSERTVVEGVGVSTDHWIGGERVGSAERFEDVSPIDEEVIAGVARGGAAEARAAGAAAPDAFEGWGTTA